MNTIAQLVAVLSADNASLKRGLDQANKDLKATETAAIKTGAAMDRALASGADSATVAALANDRLAASSAAAAAAATAQAAAQTAAAGKVVGAIGDITAVITVLSGVTAAMSAKFESDMQHVVNNTSLAADQVVDLRKAVISLGTDTGTPFEQLADGYMHVTNFGFQAADAQKVLAEANRSAVATGIDAGKTADLLANVMHEFAIPVNEASNAMNTLHMAGNLGNMTLQEFVDVAGVALGQAANMEVPLTDAAAAMSALTQHGFNAARAATQVTDMMVHIVSPTHEATKAIESLSKMTGVNLVKDFSSSGLAAKGLYGVLQDVYKATGGNVELTNMLIPALRGGQGAITLMGTGAKDYERSLRILNDTMSGKTDVITGAYNAQMATTTQRFKALVNTIKADFLPVGDRLAKTFENFLPVLKSTADLASQVLDAFSKLPPVFQQVVFGIGAMRILGKVLEMLTGAPSIINLLTAAMKTARIGALALGEGFGGPVVWGITAVVLAGVGLYALYNKLSDAGVKTNDVLQKEAQQHFDSAKAGIEHAKAVQELIAQYHPGVTTVQAMHDIQNKIAELSPTLVTGYDKEGNAIINMGNAARQTAIDLQNMNQAAIDAARAKAGFSAIETAQQMDARKTDIDRLKWSLHSGMVPKNSGSMWNNAASKIPGTNQDDPWSAPWSFVAARSAEQLGNPYASQYNGSDPGFIMGGVTTKVPEFQKGTPEQMAEARKRLDALQSQQTQLSQTYSTQMGQMNAAKNNVIDQAGNIGRAIASAADTVVVGTNGFCERTANNLRHQVTTLFDAFHGGSATETMSKLMERNLLMPYTPGMTLKPGDQLYSNTLGYQRGKDGKMHHFGHVETVNSAGNRMDESGIPNRFALSNFQYVFDPDRAESILNGQGYVPPRAKSNAPTKDALTAFEEAEKKRKKAAEDAAKEAEREHERLQKLFSDTHDKMQEEIDLWGKSGKAAEVAWEIKKGQFEDLAPKQKASLLAQAEELDMLARQRTLQSAKDKIAGVNFSPEKAQAIELAGGLDKWKELGDGTSKAQKQYMDLSHQLTDTTAMKSAKEAMKDLAFEEALMGDEAKQAAVAAVGGKDAWKALTAEEQKTLIGEEKHFKAIESLRDMYMSLKGSAATAFHGPAETSLQAANRQIEETLRKIGVAADDPRVKKWVAAVRGQASLEDKNSSRQFMYDQSKGGDKSLDALKDKLAGVYGPAEEAVRQWERDNADAIARLYGSMDKPTADKAIKAYEDQLRDMTEAQQKLAGQTQMRDMLADIVKQAMIMKERDPFKAWLDSYKVWDQTLNDGKGGFKLPTGMNESDMKQVYDWQQKLELVHKVADGITGVLTNAFDDAYEHGFKNFFTDVIGGFKKMMFELAMNYLMSQFTQLITKTLTGKMAGSGPQMSQVSGGGGFGNLLGGLGMSILGGLLPGAVGGWMGGGGGAPTASVPMPPAPTVYYAAAGGMVPGPEGAGDIVPAMLSPGEVVVPRSRQGRRGTAGGDTHYHVHVSVPDVGQVRRATTVAMAEVQSLASRETARRR